ncbi:MAG TPA: redoxin domain-containing protein [Acidimicrobiia bacterium]|jgi:cytochrome c biogenesis protein CcmG/thiol:disulfide interchange protein DsbE|nr:redoxin domain-containing protein [Acidimicrobiia bacterium]
MNRGIRWVGYGIALAAVVFAVVLASRFGTDPGLVDSPLLGQPAPMFELPPLEGGETISLGDLEGDIVVVNFFASWCLQCRNEHADLTSTADAFADQGVTLVQIAYQESPPASLQYLEVAGRSPSALYLADPGSRTAIAYGVFGIPETFFIDEEGTVVGKIIGESDALTLGATIDAIKRGESPGQNVTGDTQQAPDG